MRPVRRLLLLAVACTAMAPGARAAEAEPGLCLSPGAALEAVSTKQVVAPGLAILAARRAVPNADVLRAALCHEADELVYRIMVLRKDGRLVRVIVDAPDGVVKTVR